MNAHRDYHRQRELDTIRAARLHPLAQVHPLERRSPLGRLFRRRPLAKPARVFRIA
jgi:hypothetical protein